MNKSAHRKRGSKTVTREFYNDKEISKTVLKRLFWTEKENGKSLTSAEQKERVQNGVSMLPNNLQWSVDFALGSFECGMGKNSSFDLGYRSLLEAG